MVSLIPLGLKSCGDLMVSGNNASVKCLYSKPYYPWLILLLAAGFFFAEYFARVAPSVMVPDLMSSFRVNALSLGALSAFFYYAYIAMQLPVGTLMDKYGPRRLLTTMSALCGVACILFSQTHSIFMADLARFLMGLSAAFAFVGALKIARTWFSPARFGFLAGLTQALGMVGAAVGEGPVSYLVKSFGWRFTMLSIGLVLLCLSVLIYVFVRDRAANQPIGEICQEVSIEPKLSLWQSFMKVVKKRQTWVNGLIIGCLYAPTAAFAELWGPSYLHAVYDFSREIAATGVGLIFIGWAISSPLAGLLSDKIKRRKPIIIASLLFSCVFMCAILYLPNLSAFELYILLFCYGVSNVGVATCYAVACEMAEPNVAATSMSFANMASVIIGAAFQPVIGWILDTFAHHNAAGELIYSAAEYRYAMLLLPVCFLVGIAGCFALKETYK